MTAQDYSRLAKELKTMRCARTITQAQIATAEKYLPAAHDISYSSFSGSLRVFTDGVVLIIDRNGKITNQLRTFHRE